jgi:hypothetical protein
MVTKMIPRAGKNFLFIILGFPTFNMQIHL